MEDDLFTAETRRMPAEVVNAVIRAVEERKTLPPPPGPPAQRLTAPMRQPPSGTRRRISADDIAAFLATKSAQPIVDSYAPESIDEVHEVRDEEILAEPQPAPQPKPEPVAVAPRKRTPLAPIPVAAFPRGAYPAPRIEVHAQPLVERPLAVFLVALAAMVLVLAPLVYVLLR